MRVDVSSACIHPWHMHAWMDDLLAQARALALKLPSRLCALCPRQPLDGRLGAGGVWLLTLRLHLSSQACDGEVAISGDSTDGRRQTCAV